MTTSSPVSAPLVGTVVAGEFVVESKLGAGGMGTVYRRRQQSSGRAVAIKAVHPHLAIALYAVGGGALATGVVLLVLAIASDPSVPVVAASPAPGGLLVSAHAHF